MENPIQMDDLGVPLFSETSTFKMASKKTYCIFTPPKRRSGQCRWIANSHRRTWLVRQRPAVAAKVPRTEGLHERMEIYCLQKTHGKRLHTYFSIMIYMCIYIYIYLLYVYKFLFDITIAMIMIDHHYYCWG